jgi:hypothetical protein
MTRDPGDPSAELARLLRRIDELDGGRAPRLPAAPGLDKFEDTPTHPPSDPSERGKALIAKPDAPLQLPAERADIASKSRRPLRTIAIVVAATALVAVILLLRMPSISIVVIPNGESKFQLQTLARTPPDADARPESQRSVASNLNGAVTTAMIRPATPNATDPAPIKPARPRLAVAPEKTSLQRDQVWPLDTHITVEGRGDTLFVRGLAAGTKLSVGQPLDADGWELDVGGLGGAVIIPPSGFLGTMDLTLVLRLDGATSDQQSLQVEWVGPVAAAPVSTVRLEPSDVVRLLERGRELLANREIAAARAVFRRLADNGEPRGAFALAETYEPSTLERLSARGLLPDMAAARTWYETAKVLGSTEAQHRLDLLAARSQ